jgi:hypothetical protein
MYYSRILFKNNVNQSMKISIFFDFSSYIAGFLTNKPFDGLRAKV